MFLVSILVLIKKIEGKSSNWVPTKSGEDFFIMFRFYGPEKAVFDKSWQLNDIELDN
jgi:hypothetical protein